MCKHNIRSWGYALNAATRYVPQDNLRILYFSLVHPHLNYSNLLWGSAKTDQDTSCQKDLLTHKGGLTVDSGIHGSYLVPPRQLHMVDARDCYRVEIRSDRFERNINAGQLQPHTAVEAEET